MDLGHLENPDLTVTLDYATAKAILVDGNPQAGMQAFMAGKIKVQGDMTKLMAMQQGTPDPAAAEIAAKIKEITRLINRPALRILSRQGVSARSTAACSGRPASASWRPRASPALVDARRRRRPARGRRRRRRRGTPRRRRRPPRRASLRTTETVCITWMPTTTPSWVIICWMAPATPRSRSSTALAMLAASDGDEQPRPMPDRASDPMMTRSDEPGATRRERHHRRQHERRARPPPRSAPPPGCAT